MLLSLIQARIWLTGCSFADIAKAIGRDEVWTAALFYGQATPSQDDIKALEEFFGSGQSSLISSLAQPNQYNINRGDLGPMPPTDPVIYRLFEVCVNPTPLCDYLDSPLTAFTSSGRALWFMAILSRRVIRVQVERSNVDADEATTGHHS